MGHSTIGQEKSLGVHFEKEKSRREDYDFQIIVPVTVEYQNLPKGSALIVEANPTGNHATYTYNSFRGQFLTAVEDEHSSIKFSKYFHRVSPREKSNMILVERSSWEEGFRPSIEFVPSKQNGNLSVNFLGIFSTRVENDRPIFDHSTGIQISVKEHHPQGPSKTLTEFNIQLENNPENDYTYSDKKLLEIYNEETHRLSGKSASIHPKQLITVGLLEEVLNDVVSQSFPKGIDIGYIGLDTGENLLSVLRYLNRASITSNINNIFVFFERKWDDDFLKVIAPTINRDPIFADKVKWIEVKSPEAGQCKVDFLISTYVAVWAMNDPSTTLAEQDDYFRDTFRWCKNNAILLSVDPKEHNKIARSSRFAGRISPEPFYKTAGFDKEDRIAIGTNNTCTYSVWTKGDWEVKWVNSAPKEKEIHSNSNQSAGTTKPDNLLTKFLSNYAGFIKCAGIHTEAGQLVNADTLYDDQTGFVQQRSMKHDAFGLIRPKIGGKSVELFVSEQYRRNGKRGWKCGEVTLEFTSKYSGIEEKDINKFISSISHIFSDGLLEVLFALYSPVPVVISGDPGEGKSVRMRQIASAMSADPTVAQVPLFIKAKDLVRYLGEWTNPNPLDELNFLDQASILGKSFFASNQETIEMAGITEKEVIQSILDIHKKSPDDADAGLVLLIDAIDEIDDKRKIDLLLGWIVDFKDWFGGGFARTVLSTRPSEQVRIENKFDTRNAVKMYFEDAALAKTFPQALVKAWSVPDSVASEIEVLFQQEDVLENINRPLLIGWLCRFVHDKIELGDLTKSYRFYEKILDISTDYTRFEQEHEVDKFTQVERESIQRMRNCIAFLDLIGTFWKNDIEFTGLNSHESRMKCLSLRHKQSLFPGLESMTDAVAHQVFFEDMSLLYVTGNGGLGWTHEFLREYAAALFWTELTTSKRKTLTNLITKNAALFGEDVDLNSILEQHVFPYRRYFQQAVNELEPTGEATEPNESGSTERDITVHLNKSEHKLHQLRNQIIHGRDVHPEEFAEMLTENFCDDIRLNDVNSDSFKVILNYFYEQDVNWILGRTGNQNDDTSKTYLELITGGVIPKLAEKLLTEKERNETFNKLFKDSIFEKKEFDFEKIKAHTFEKFINSSKTYNLAQYQKILTFDFQQKDIILDKNNLNLDIATLNKLQNYIDSYTNNDAPKALFRKFYEAASPDVGGRKEKALRKLLGIEQENGNEQAEREILKQLFNLLWTEKRHDESQSMCEDILSRENLGDSRLKSYCLTTLAALEKRSGAYERSERHIREAMEIEKKIGLMDDEAGSLMFLAKLSHERGMQDKASFFLDEAELIVNQLGEENQKARSLYLLGDTHIATESFDDATRVYHQCLQINRNLSNQNHVAACLFGLGLAAFYKHDYSNALDYYSQSLRLNQEIGNQLEEAIMLRRIGNIHRFDGNLLRARDFLTRALDLALKLKNDEESARIYKLLGHVERNEERYLYSEDNYEESFSLYKKLGNDEQISLVAYHLGNIKYKLKKFKESEKLLLISYDLDKAQGTLGWQNMSGVALAKTLRGQKRHEDAETLLKECIEANVREGVEELTFVDLVLELAHTLRIQRKFADAKSQYNKVLAIGIKMAKQSGSEEDSDYVLASAYFYLGRVNQNLGHFEKAREMLRKSLDISLKNEWKYREWRSLNALGWVHRALGEFSQAETHYRRCLEIDREEGDLESQATICTRLGLVADEIGNHFKSENWYREAYRLSVATENIKYQSIALCRIGEAQNLRGDYAEAELTLERCIEVDRQLNDEGAQRSIAITFEALGQAKLGLGKYAEAREMYQKSLEIAELLTDDVLLSSTHNRLGKLEEAEKNVPKALYHMQLSKKFFNNINHPPWDRASQYTQRTIQRLEKEHYILVFDEETQTVIEWTDFDDDPTEEKHHRSNLVFKDIEAEEVPSVVKLEKKSSEKEITPTLSAPSLGEFISQFTPLSIDILGMPFFFDERYVARIIRMYWKKSNDIPTPISIAVAQEKMDDEQTTRHHIIDGRKNLTILLAAIFEAARKLDLSFNDISGLSEITYHDNTDNGTLNDLFSNPDEFGDDVRFFIANIHSILDMVEQDGDLNIFIHAILNGKIACTAYELRS